MIFKLNNDSTWSFGSIFLVRQKTINLSLIVSNTHTCAQTRMYYTGMFFSIKVKVKAKRKFAKSEDLHANIWWQMKPQKTSTFIATNFASHVEGNMSKATPRYSRPNNNEKVIANWLLLDILFKVKVLKLWLCETKFSILISRQLLLFYSLINEIIGDLVQKKVHINGQLLKEVSR